MTVTVTVMVMVLLVCECKCALGSLDLSVVELRALVPSITAVAATEQRSALE